MDEGMFYRRLLWLFGEWTIGRVKMETRKLVKIEIVVVVWARVVCVLVELNGKIWDIFWR